MASQNSIDTSWKNMCLDKDYSCLGSSLILYRYQPFFSGFIFACYQQQDFMRQYRLQHTYSDKVALEQELLKAQSLPPGSLKSLQWVVCKKDQYHPIGLAGLVNYQPQHRNAELLLGFPQQSKYADFEGISSYPLQAALLLIEFAFKAIRLNKLLSLVYGYNKAAQQATLKLGFHQEGILRKHICNPQGEFIDLYQNALFLEDIKSHESPIARYSKRVLKRDITLEQQKNTPNILADDPIAALLQQVQI